MNSSAVLVVVQLDRFLKRREIALHRRFLRPLRGTGELGDGDTGDDTEDHHDDEKLDEGEPARFLPVDPQ